MNENYIYEKCRFNENILFKFDESLKKVGLDAERRWSVITQILNDGLLIRERG